MFRRRVQYILPASFDDTETFTKKKSAILNKLVPTSVVPAATSNAFLMVGARGKDECYDNKPNVFLLIAGIVSLAMAVMGTVFRWILEGILWDRKVTRGEFWIIRVMDFLSNLVVVVELSLLISGTVIFYPFLFHGKWQYDNEDDKETFCSLGTVMFPTIFLGSSWVLFILTALAYIVIHCAHRSPSNPEDQKPIS